MTVDKAVLSVDASAHSKVYGTADPAATFTFSGFVNGDTTVTVTGAPVCSIAGHDADVGNYPTTYSRLPGNLSTANYSFVAGSKTA